MEASYLAAQGFAKGGKASEARRRVTNSGSASQCRECGQYRRGDLTLLSMLAKVNHQTKSTDELSRLLPRLHLRPSRPLRSGDLSPRRLSPDWNHLNSGR
jgi:hypothetical protein